MRLLLFLFLYLTMATALVAQNEDTMNEATFGAGCFWCVEAIFQDLKGVLSVESGYTGGNIKNPSYKEICTGLTGHAEVIKIEFDSTIISYDNLVRIFYVAHDPTTLNRQGNDVGTQYRSAIFYQNADQLRIAKAVTKEISDQGIFEDPIVTSFEPLVDYYPAEKYHQNYYKDNPNQGYCRAIIEPKVRKFREKYFELLKKP